MKFVPSHSHCSAFSEEFRSFAQYTRALCVAIHFNTSITLSDKNNLHSFFMQIKSNYFDALKGRMLDNSTIHSPIRCFILWSKQKFVLIIVAFLFDKLFSLKCFFFHRGKQFISINVARNLWIAAERYTTATNTNTTNLKAFIQWYFLGGTSTLQQIDKVISFTAPLYNQIPFIVQFENN